MLLLSPDNQGCREVEQHGMGKPAETSQIRYTFGFELIFGHCSLESFTVDFFSQSVTWLPVGPWPTDKERGLHSMTQK